MGDSAFLFIEKRSKLVHPDRAVIRLGKASCYKGRLTDKEKDECYQEITPAKVLTRSGVDVADIKIIRFPMKSERLPIPPTQAASTLLFSPSHDQTDQPGAKEYQSAC